MIHQIVSVSGRKRSGKNSLADAFIKEFAAKNILAKQYAFADELKKELNPLFLLNAGVSAFTEDPVEKELIRKTLISYGTGYWRNKDPDHWIKKLEKTLVENEVPHVAILTDTRFYSNELPWVEKNGGITIHLSRYDENGNLYPCAGEDEMANDPILEERAAHKIKWNNFHGDDNLRYYKSQQFFNQIFADKIPQWQKDFPLPKI
jgi:hypothetical protein